MLGKLKKIWDWYRYILGFHPVKYLGISVMAGGPLFLIYRFIFQNSSAAEAILGSIGALIIGSFIWSVGWDPYA